MAPFVSDRWSCLLHDLVDVHQKPLKLPVTLSCEHVLCVFVEVVLGTIDLKVYGAHPLRWIKMSKVFSIHEHC